MSISTLIQMVLNFAQNHVIDVTEKMFNDRDLEVSLVTAKTRKKQDTLTTSDVST